MLESKPKLVQISGAYGQPAEGSAAIPRNKYVEIKQERPQSDKQRDWPEYKTCKSMTEAIITGGTEKVADFSTGTMRNFQPLLTRRDYNHQRTHSSLNYRTPAEFARLTSYGKGVGSTRFENAPGASNFLTASTAAG